MYCNVKEARTIHSHGNRSVIISVMKCMFEMGPFIKYIEYNVCYKNAKGTVYLN